MKAVQIGEPKQLKSEAPDKCVVCGWAWGDGKVWWCNLCIDIELCPGPEGDYE